MAVSFDTGIFSVIGLASEILVGAKLYWYASGTSTPLATYSDEGLTVPNTNPVLANASGRFPPIWLRDADYKMILTAAGGDPTSPLVTRDPVDGTTLVGPDGSGRVGFSQSNTYPAGSIGRHDQGWVSVTDAPFYAKCDGTTDDTTAFQSAIDYCVGFVPPKGLHIPAAMRVASKVYVDLPVDGRIGNFVIDGGEVSTAVTGPLISTRLTNPTTPQSEGLVLQNIRFVHTSPSSAGWLLDDSLLRLQVVNCTGFGMKITSGSRYLQDWDIGDSNRFTDWQGWLIDTPRAYSGALGPKMEHAPNGMGMHFGAVERTTIGGLSALAEGILGPIAKIDGAIEVDIEGWYTEGNSTNEFIIGSGGGSCTAVSIEKCRFSPNDTNVVDTTFAAIVLGSNVHGVDSRSNLVGTLGCYLYDDTALGIGELSCHGDRPVDAITGAVNLNALNKTGRRVLTFPNGLNDFAGPVFAHAGGGSGSATQLTNVVTYVTSATAGDSVKLPAAVLGQFVTFFNSGPASATAYPLGTDTIAANNAIVASTVVPLAHQALFYCLVAGQWTRTDISTYGTIPPATGGSTIDTQARNSIASIITILQEMGAAT